MIIAVVGKGGVGKTTIAALLMRRLLAAGQKPVLAVDADPSNCLGAALGVKVQDTLGDLRERFRNETDRPAAVSKTDWLALGVEEMVSEASGFDLLTMGRPEGPGCYCAVNNLLRDNLDRLGRTYRHILLDCEAGLEHLSRRTAGRPDRLVCVTGKSRMAAETVRRALDLCQELHGRLPSHVELVLNGFDADDALTERSVSIAAGDAHAFTRKWVVPHDEQISLLESEGLPLFELDSASPALQALDGWEETP